jgi:hypothetical protein
MMVAVMKLEDDELTVAETAVDSTVGQTVKSGVPVSSNINSTKQHLPAEAATSNNCIVS